MVQEKKHHHQSVMWMERGVADLRKSDVQFGMGHSPDGMSHSQTDSNHSRSDRNGQCVCDLTQDNISLGVHLNDSENRHWKITCGTNKHIRDQIGLAQTGGQTHTHTHQHLPSPDE